MKPGSAEYSFQDVYFTVESGGGLIRTFRFSDGLALASASVSVAPGRESYNSDPIVDTDMALISYRQNYVVLANVF